jgi:hypothetical protein
MYSRVLEQAAGWALGACSPTDSRSAHTKTCSLFYNRIPDGVTVIRINARKDWARHRDENAQSIPQDTCTWSLLGHAVKGTCINRPVEASVDQNAMY